jgi:hypothetical protein
VRERGRGIGGDEGINTGLMTRTIRYLCMIRFTVEEEVSVLTNYIFDTVRGGGGGGCDGQSTVEKYRLRAR